MKKLIEKRVKFMVAFLMAFSMLFVSGAHLSAEYRSTWDSNVELVNHWYRWNNWNGTQKGEKFAASTMSRSVSASMCVILYGNGSRMSHSDCYGTVNSSGTRSNFKEASIDNGRTGWGWTSSDHSTTAASWDYKYPNLRGYYGSGN